MQQAAVLPFLLRMRRYDIAQVTEPDARLHLINGFEETLQQHKTCHNKHVSFSRNGALTYTFGHTTSSCKDTGIWQICCKLSLALTQPRVKHY